MRFLICTLFSLFLFSALLTPHPVDAQNSCSCDGKTPTTGTVTGQRGRVKITSNNLVADNGCPLRGETFWSLGTPEEKYFQILNKYNLNTARILIYREPQLWSHYDSTVPCGTMQAPACVQLDNGLYRRQSCKWDCQCRDYWETGRTSCPVSDFGRDASASDFDLNGNKRWDDNEYQLWLNHVNRVIIPKVDAWVAATRSRGVYLMIDYHPVLGYDKFDSLELWKLLAPRYKDETHVIYEAINEPQGGSSDNYRNKQDLIDHEARLYQQLRKDAPDTHLIMWTFANVGGNMKALVDTPPTSPLPKINYTNASVGFHIYGYNGGRQNALNLRQAYPAIQTEIGDINNTYKEYVRVTEQDKFSWIILHGFQKMEEGQNLGIQVTWSKDPFYAGTCSQVTPQPQTWDLNKSGTIDVLDFSQLIHSFVALFDFPDISTFSSKW